MALDVAVRSEPVVLDRLRAVSARRGLDDLSQKLHEVSQMAAGDLAAVESALGTVGSSETAVTASAEHLLRLSGKRLRPLCVALAARIGDGFTSAARELAVAVELVHTATLLHDDVVDTGDVRRGAPAARVLYGNAASIFAGDWLLVEALRRVERSGVAGALPRLLAVIDDMILAESLQLDQRGRLVADRDVYWRVVEGKTASLFRWALFAGAQAGGLSETATDALEGFGLHLGVAFQLIDDVLDFTGHTPRLGKALFADLREGKMTLPLILAVEGERGTRAVLEEILAFPEDHELPAALVGQVSEALRSTGAIEAAREIAQARVGRALECLEAVPPTPACRVLATVAAATLSRES
jgi:octaprenyl-diphosphate synthase